jgi:hypothetical protein
MAGRGTNSLGQGNTSSLEQAQGMPCLSGGNTSTTPSRIKTELNAPSFGTKTADPISRPSLSDRLTPSLISAGLVRGITPRSVRRQLGAQILDIASNKLAGKALGKLKMDCPFSSVCQAEAAHA